MNGEEESGRIAAVPDLGEIGQFVAPFVLELNSRIRVLAAPEAPVTPQRQRVIVELGIAAYHLTLASQEINPGSISKMPGQTDSAAPETVSPFINITNLNTNPEERTSTEDAIVIDKFIEGFCSQAKFSVREKKLIRKIVEQMPPSQWFSQKDLILDEKTYKTEASRKQAFPQLTGKLVDIGVLVTNGKTRGGRKYRVNEEVVPAIETRIIPEPEGSKKK